MKESRGIKNFLLVCFLFSIANVIQGKELTELKPPSPKKVPFIMEAHGVERVDNYYWMRDDTRKSKKVLNHLKLENQYLEGWFASGGDLRKKLFKEITDRIPKKEESVPIRMGSYEYFRRYKPNKEHPIIIRRVNKNSPEQVLLDVNKLAVNSDFYQLANWSISPTEQILAYAEDTTGRREYSIKFKNLLTKEVSEITINGTSGDMAWSSDSNYFFYVRRDPETLLPFQVYRHLVGSKQIEDTLIYEEKDPTFHVSVGNSRSMQFIEIDISSTTSSETLLLKSSNPLESPAIFFPRVLNHLYSVEHDPEHNRFLIHTNWKAKNFRLMETALQKSKKRSQWQEIVPHKDSVLLQSVLSYPKNIVLMERESGLRRLRVLDAKGNFERVVSFNDPSYTAYLAANPEYTSTKFYYGYSSMRSPDAIYSVDLQSGRKRKLKQAEIKGPFSPSLYKVQRKEIKARDGTLVPVSFVYRRDLYKKGKNPLFVYGYGSYGISVDAGFSSTRLSLLDRGFIFAIAHVRGGQDLGREWYEDGKIFNKLNTFYDFIDVTKGLVNLGYGQAGRVYAGGGSAGGLLMGSIINMEPNLYNGIISNVPFVDVITTMSDESIPLTTGEYDEWGNPANKKEFKYMMKYSPYDNIDSYSYPSILVTAGLWDSQVQYYEPAKYVAKLRDYSTSGNPILFKVNLTAGHGGVSGRFASLEEVAMEYAFLLRSDNN
jgi:oligopeptidase B